MLTIRRSHSIRVAPGVSRPLASDTPTLATEAPRRILIVGVGYLQPDVDGPVTLVVLQCEPDKPSHEGGGQTAGRGAFAGEESLDVLLATPGQVTVIIGRGDSARCRSETLWPRC